MNSGDGSDRSDPRSPNRNPRKRLELDGDASRIPNADRASTVIVNADDPTPPPSAQQFPPSRPTPAPQSRRFVSQAAPAVSRDHLSADAPTPPPGSLSTAFPDEPTDPGYTLQPPRQPRSDSSAHNAEHITSTGFIPPENFHPTGKHAAVSGSNPNAQGPGSAAHNAEHVTSTGFIPPENFRPTGKHAAVSGPGKQTKPAFPGASPGKKFKGFTIPEFTFLDDTGPLVRAQYAGGAFLGGALAGTCLGVLNCVLQGWDVADGLSQIFWLSVIMGMFFAIIAALRPERVDELLSQISFFQDTEPPDQIPRFDE